MKVTDEMVATVCEAIYPGFRRAFATGPNQRKKRADAFADRVRTGMELALAARTAAEPEMGHG